MATLVMPQSENQKDRREGIWPPQPHGVVSLSHPQYRSIFVFLVMSNIRF